jgi:hypothetical protein
MRAERAVSRSSVNSSVVAPTTEIAPVPHSNPTNSASESEAVAKTFSAGYAANQASAVNATASSRPTATSKSGRGQARASAAIANKPPPSAIDVPARRKPACSGSVTRR